MLNIGETFSYLGLSLALMLIFNVLERHKLVLRLMTWAIPLPFAAAVCGWLVREVGRQPWVVYGVPRTDQAASLVGAGTVRASFVAFTAVLVVLVAADYLLIPRRPARSDRPGVRRDGELRTGRRPGRVRRDLPVAPAGAHLLGELRWTPCGRPCSACWSAAGSP